MTSLPKLCLVICGGTITMTRDPKSGTLIPAYILSDLLKRVPELETIAEYDTVFVSDIDSTNMTPEIWVRAARVIAEKANDYDGFIVTHGTDSMAYSASALSFLLQGLGKPVIFTGSQTSISEITGSDARNNLIFAAKFAKEDIGEVAIYFGNELLRGNRARKFSQFDFDAFKSFNMPPIGKAGIRPKLAEHRIKRSCQNLKPVPDLKKGVFLLKYFPGLQPNIIGNILKLGYHAMVIEGLGAGNLPTHIDFASEIKRATAAGIPIVVTTQCIVGAAEMHIYEVGKNAEINGAISGLDMTPEAAVTKLHWILSQTTDFAEITKLVQTNLVGELSS
ncbi:MAG: asparaginase [bacterium]|nr:asparaginase [bacterium]